MKPSLGRLSKKRIARITLGALSGAVIGWMLAGATTGSTTLAGTYPEQGHSDGYHALSNPGRIQEKLKPDAQAVTVAYHLLAGLGIITLAGLVVGVLAPDSSKEPMARAAAQDSTTEKH